MLNSIMHEYERDLVPRQDISEIYKTKIYVIYLSSWAKV